MCWLFNYGEEVCLSMLLAEAATASTSNFNAFDIFVILFTILIFIGLEIFVTNVFVK